MIAFPQLRQGLIAAALLAAIAGPADASEKSKPAAKPAKPARESARTDGSTRRRVPGGAGPDRRGGDFGSAGATVTTINDNTYYVYGGVYCNPYFNGTQTVYVVSQV